MQWVTNRCLKKLSVIESVKTAKQMSKLQPGDQAPAFEGRIQDGKQVSLEDYRGKKLILFFYPKDNTPGCTAEVCSLRDGYEELSARGFELLGVSPDGEKKHQGFIQKYQLPFPLIADESKEILRAYGVWGPKALYGKLFEGVNRSTFILDEGGKILHIIEKVKTKDHARQILDLMPG